MSNQPDWWHSGLNYGRPVRRCADQNVHEAHPWHGNSYSYEVDLHDLYGNPTSFDQSVTPRYRCPGIAPEPPLARKLWVAIRRPVLIAALLVAFFAAFALAEEVFVPAVFSSR